MDIVLLPDMRRVMAWSTAVSSPTVKQCLLAFVNVVSHLNYNISCSSFNMIYIYTLMCVCVRARVCVCVRARACASV